jgi:hypothetical protein
VSRYIVYVYIDAAVCLQRLRAAIPSARDIRCIAGNKDSAEPDPDGCYSTRQIAGAVYGEALSEEKLRTQREVTRKLTLENSITEASVVGFGLLTYKLIGHCH